MAQIKRRIRRQVNFWARLNSDTKAKLYFIWIENDLSLFDETVKK